MKSSAPTRTRAAVAARPSPGPHAISNVPLNLIALTGAMVLAVVFFSHRAADPGRLPVLIQSFTADLLHEKVFRFAGLARSLIAALIALLVVVSWYGAGELIVTQMRRALTANPADQAARSFSPALEIARKCAFGAGFWSLLWFGLGLCGLYRKPVAIAALMVGLLLFAWSVVCALKSWRSLQTDIVEQQSQSNWFERAALYSIALPVLLALISALAPPTGKDALIYHLALPKTFLLVGGLTEVPHNIANYYSLGVEMNGVWVLLLGGLFNQEIAEAAFGAVTFAFFPLLLLAVYGWAREFQMNRGTALIAVALFAAIPTVWWSASSGYTDLALAFYMALTIQAAAKWWCTLNPLDLAFLACALGCALTVKLIAFFAVFPLLLIFLFKARQLQETHESASSSPPTSRILWQGMLALVLAGLLGCPWYVRNWVRSGSPVFPFYVSLWKGSAPGWDAERSEMLSVFVNSYGGLHKGILDYVATPFYLSLTAQPEESANYDGVLGISFLLGVLFLFRPLRRRSLAVELKVILFFSALIFLGWMFTSQQMRFLLQTLPGLAVVIAVSVTASTNSEERPERAGAMQWLLLATTLAGLLVTCAWFLERNPLRVVLGGESRTAYLERRLDYYPYYEIVNSQLPADARVWLINLRRDSYHIERPFFSDYLFEDYTLTQSVKESKNLQELRARICTAGITHLLVRYTLLLDYAYTPVVDEKKAEAENREKFELLKSFLTEGTKILRSDAQFMLVELPRE